MDGLTLATTATTSSSPYSSVYPSKSIFSPVSIGVRRLGSGRRELGFPRKRKFIVFAAQEEEPKFDQWDQMELKFGRMLGEDPKLTLAKPLEESQIESRKELSDGDSVDSALNFAVDAALQGRPNRLDNSVKDETSASGNKETTSADPERGYCDELMNLPPTSPLEDADWSRAEDLLRTGNRADVELVSASPRGFIVSFGSLVGFLPYRNLTAKWKFLAFECWLKQKGLDPSLYKQNIGIAGSSDISDRNFSADSSVNLDVNQKVGKEITPDMRLEDLLRIYDQEKLKFLLSFVGQKIKANIIVADKKTRKFTVSLRAREKEKSVQKKRNLIVRPDFKSEIL